MIITWLGQNCFKIEGKNASVIIDPPHGIGATKVAKQSIDILLLPRPLLAKEQDFLKNDPVVVQYPGEYESKNVVMQGIAAGKTGETVYRFAIDGIRFGHLANQITLETTVENFLEGVDVLFVPAGGGEVMTPNVAADAVNSIEPRIVIPMHIKQKGVTKLESVDAFCKAYGAPKPEAVQKFSLVKKDLPAEETKVVILDA